MFKLCSHQTVYYMDKREHIISNALELFAEKGFEGCSIRDIATRAGVNVAMVNYYFGSKEKLFEAIVETKAGHMKELLEALVKDNAKTELEKLDIIAESYVNRFFSQNKFHRVLYQEMLMLQREDLHKHIATLFSKNTNNIKNIIEQGIRKKIFRKKDPVLLIASMIGTISQVLFSRYLCNMMLGKPEDHDPYSDPQFKKRIIKYIQEMMRDVLLEH